MAISVRERVRAPERLKAIAFELNAASVWLAREGAGTESDQLDQLDQAAARVLAACWLLERPIRPQLPPSRWQGAAQPANGCPSR